MIGKLDTITTFSLVVVNANGDRVVDDTPFAKIKDRKTGEFFNGMFFTKDECSLEMSHVGEGVYIYDFLNTRVSDFDVVLKSDKYKISETFILKIVNENNIIYPWNLGEKFIFHYPSDKPMKASIKNDTTNMYYAGVEGWVETKSYIDMEATDSHCQTLTITFEEESKYEIIIYDKDFSQKDIMILDVMANSESIVPIVIGSETFKKADGSNTRITTEFGSPIEGVKVSCYDPVQKNIISTTITDKEGKWSMMVKPARYIFIFEKPGFVSVSLNYVGGENYV